MAPVLDRPAPADGIDLLDPLPFAEDREHELYDRLRAGTPVAFCPEPDGPGFWSLVRHADVRDATRDHATFCSGQGTQIVDARAEGKGAPSIHNADPPEHGPLRKLTQPTFQPRGLRRLEEPVAAMVDAVLDTIEPGVPFDVVSQVTVRLPVVVLAELLGVARADHDHLVAWTNALTTDARVNAELQAEAREQLFAHFRTLAEHRRRVPGDDLVTTLVHAEIDGRPLTQEQLDAYFLLLVIAGNETTRNLLSGGLQALCAQPAAWRALQEDPGLAPRAVEELLRYVSPVIHMRRTATRDVEVGGQAIAAGDKVVVWFAAANRDPAAFDDPGVLRLDREPNRHVGFGQGIHFCLGAPLARLEARLVLEGLVRRFTVLEAAGDPVRTPSNWFRGLASLPVVLR